MNVALLSAVEQRRLLASGELSAVELLELCLQQYETHNPELNAVIETQIDSARDAARGADESLARG
ncbi:MAG: amidase, partial [Acidimicrobiales bacterium]